MLSPCHGYPTHIQQEWGFIIKLIKSNGLNLREALTKFLISKSYHSKYLWITSWSSMNHKIMTDRQHTGKKKCIGPTMSTYWYWFCFKQCPDIKKMSINLNPTKKPHSRVLLVVFGGTTCLIYNHYVLSSKRNGYHCEKRHWLISWYWIYSSALVSNLYKI